MRSGSDCAYARHSQYTTYCDIVTTQCAQGMSKMRSGTLQDAILASFSLLGHPFGGLGTFRGCREGAEVQKSSKMWFVGPSVGYHFGVVFGSSPHRFFDVFLESIF